MTSSDLPRLPIVATVREAVSEVVQARRALFDATIVPAFVAWAFSAGTEQMQDELIRWGGDAVSWAMWSLLAVSCHRIILLGEDSLPGARGIYWTSRETRFAVWAYVTIAPIVLAMFAFGLAALLLGGGLKWLVPGSFDLLPSTKWLAIVPTLLVGAWGVARASLILPSVAIDRREAFWNVWMLSHGQGFRATVITMTLPAIAIAIAYLDVTYLPHRTAFPIEVARWCLHFVATPFEIALLSVTYRDLMAQRALHRAT